MSGRVNLELFRSPAAEGRESERLSASLSRPLADLLRPVRLSELQGVERLEPWLVQLLSDDTRVVPSIVFWGPPGSGKTTMARILGRRAGQHFVELSAVFQGIREIREVVELAERCPDRTVLFVDEIHRFNKAQQDALLPHIERGLLTLLGATTEHPPFYLSSALLSRARVVTLNAHDEASLAALVRKGLDRCGSSMSSDAVGRIVRVAAGDARQALTLVEALSQHSQNPTDAEVDAYLKGAVRLRYDRDGDQHYQLVSAFIKSVRGSDPDAALYWGFRMLESGEDPKFLLRRMIILASEDIGNADPRALELAVATAQAFDRIGMPEGRIPIAQCICYLASAPKSNRSYEALGRALEAIAHTPNASVPLHLRNATTALMKREGYGHGYDYPHEHPAGIAPGGQYLPDELKGAEFYRPSSHGLEERIAARLAELRQLRKGN